MIMHGMPPRNAKTPFRRVPYGVAAFFAALAAVLGAASSQPAGPALPEQVIAELRRANAARTQRLNEQQEWAMEAERLELLLATVNDEAARFTAEADQAAKDQAEFKKQLAALRARQERLEAIEEAIDTVCERLEEALDALAARSLPGLVPPDRAAGITEPDRRLAAGARRLEMAERRACKAAVEIVQGNLDGKTVTVKLLRLGGVSAWWLALDGDQAGTAAMAADVLTLRRADRPADVQAIRKALAIVEGRAAPDWVLLPFARKPVKQAGGTQP